MNNIKHIICISIVGLWPALSDAFDGYKLYAMAFENPYHTVNTPVSTATNDIHTPTSIFNTYDTDGAIIRTYSDNQYCEFRWGGSTGTMSQVMLEQIRLDIPYISSMCVCFDIYFPATTTNYLDDYYDFTVLLDAKYRDNPDNGFDTPIEFRGDGGFWNGALVGSFQTGVWHSVSILADINRQSYEFFLDNEHLFDGALKGDDFSRLRFSLRDRFGKGTYSVRLDNLSVSTGLPVIESFSAMGDEFMFSLRDVIPNISTTTLQRTESLVPPTWSNVVDIVSTQSAFTVYLPTNNINGFYRLLMR